MDPTRRVEVLLSATPGRWVVLSEDETALVAESDSFEAAAAAAEEKGVADPLVLFVPMDWTPRIL